MFTWPCVALSAAEIVLSEISDSLSDGVVGARVEYRKTLAMSYVHQIATQLLMIPTDPTAVPLTAAENEHMQAGSWEFALPDGSSPSPVGAAIPKLDSSGVTTGEAEFVDDIPSPPGCKVGAYPNVLLGS